MITLNTDIRDKNTSTELIQVDLLDAEGTKIGEVQKAVNSIEYQYILRLERRIEALEASLAKVLKA